jgi:TolB-like protein/Tfp pilus assembly protein PilF
MTTRPSSLQALFAEMKRRRVFKVMAVYGAVAFVLLQIADIAFEPLGLPAWTLTFVLVLAMIGLPLAIVLAWAFESTPDGVRRTAPAPEEEIRQMVAEPRSRRWPAGLLALGSMVLLFGTGWYMGGGGRGDGGRSANLLGVSEAQASDLRTLAALPFENVNQTDENRLIAFGIHDDLLTQLSRIGALRVTSRTSVRDLGDSELSLRDIADLLGVQYILEGSVRSAGNQVRVNVTLVDVASEETMWGAQYDEEVTPENLLEIQGRISRQVIEELEARLTPEEDAALASMRPAASSVAQQWYYRAMEAYTASPEGARRARDAMLRAVEADSGYVAAWSQLAKFESRLAWIGEDRLEESRTAMEHAESLAPGSVEAYLARGYFEYYGRRNFDAALSAFRAAERLAPSDADAKVAVGLILRRQGQWEASTEAMKVGVQLDPRNIDPVQFLAENLAFVGAYEAADAVIERALTVDPADPEIRAYKIRNLIHLDRDAGRARRLADELALDPDELEEAGVLAGLAALAGDYERSLTSLDRWQRPEADLVQVGRSLHRARMFLFMEDPASARAAADTALMLIDEIPLEGRLGTTFRGWAHAMAGRREAAMPLLREAEREIRSWEDHVDPTTRALEVVDAYGLLGEIDRGIGLLEELIDRPAVNFSVSRLLLDPALEPYRGDPRFAELIERRERFEADAAEWAEASGAWLP